MALVSVRPNQRVAQKLHVRGRHTQLSDVGSKVHRKPACFTTRVENTHS